MEFVITPHKMKVESSESGYTSKGNSAIQNQQQIVLFSFTSFEIYKIGLEIATLSEEYSSVMRAIQIILNIIELYYS
jgi:L-asparagine transporter-like permease